MHLGWPWRSRSGSVHRADAAVAEPPAHPEPAVERPPAAWPSLPRLQRAIESPLRPVASLDTFAATLSAHQNPSLLGPLGHAVDPEQHGGLVDGLASVVPGPPTTYG